MLIFYFIGRMAYENHYTHMYGFGLLDDLHNFFPEILYDSSLFPDPRFEWFRHRASTLFPSVFPRQMNMYRIYSAGERQRMYNSWVSSQTIGVQPPAAPVVASAAPAAPAAATIQTTTSAAPPVNLRPVTTIRYSTPTRTYSQVAASIGSLEEEITNATNLIMRMQMPTAAAAETGSTPDTAAAAAPAAGVTTPRRPPTSVLPTAPQRPQRQTFVGRPEALATDIDILTALLAIPTPAPNTTTTIRQLPVNSLFGANELLSLLTNSLNFQDVPVVPTLNQINSASRIIEHASIPADENCAICQEHSIPGEQSAWRRLNCSHAFHTSCIMPWFQRDVHCPVCRADIRELGGGGGGGGAGGGSSSDDVDDMSVSTSSSSPQSVME